MPKAHARGRREGKRGLRVAKTRPPPQCYGKKGGDQAEMASASTAGCRFSRNHVCPHASTVGASRLQWGRPGRRRRHGSRPSPTRAASTSPLADHEAVVGGSRHQTIMLGGREECASPATCRPHRTTERLFHLGHVAPKPDVTFKTNIERPISTGRPSTRRPLT